MIFLWTTSNRIGSRLIRWGREDDCSHFAVCWDQLVPELPRSHWLVTESRLKSGVKADWLSVLEEKSSIQHEIRIKMSHQDERELYCEFIEKMGGRKYDNDGVIFFALASLIEKFGIKPPTKNPWASRKNVFCTETVEVFRMHLKQMGIDLPDSTSLLEPHDLFDMIETFAE